MMFLFAKRIARYQCVIVKMDHPNDPTPIIAQGSWEGFNRT
jgi:XTP/dITP diphosphohydrolase